MENDALKSHLKSFNILSDDEIDDFIAASTTKHLKKSEYYIKEGETCNSVTFVVSGILRSYYTSDKGDDITYCITFPNNLMTAYSSFLTNQPTQETIQAIVPTELLVISKEKIEKLAAKGHNWIQFQKTIAEQQYIEMEKRLFSILSSNASTRYEELLKYQPKYVQTIPLQYLASYLGVTQRHLSRIRREIAF